MGPQALHASYLIQESKSAEIGGIAFASLGRGRGCPLQREWRYLLIMCAFATLLITSCSRPADSSRTITIEHEISPEPARVGPTVVNFRLVDPAGKAIPGAHIALEADMSHAGMSPVFGEVREIEPGRYQAHLTFEMAGDWVILLHVTLPGGQKLERQIDVRGVRPN